MTTKQNAPPIQSLYFESVFIFSPGSVPLRYNRHARLPRSSLQGSSNPLAKTDLVGQAVWICSSANFFAAKMPSRTKITSTKSGGQFEWWFGLRRCHGFHPLHLSKSCTI